MGGIWFEPETLGDSLSETAGYKSGLALSIEEMADLLTESGRADLLLASETRTVRLRAEDYDELFYELLHKIGFTEERFNGDITGIGLSHKYRGTELEAVHHGVMELFVDIWPEVMKETQARGDKLLNPEKFMRAAAEKYGKPGLDIAYERLMAMNKGLTLSPHSGQRYTEWRNVEPLEALFKGGPAKPEVGTFIDQRYINFLFANQNRLHDMHWRKFEELTAEYFKREGFNVELGPGSNDDGIDVRVWTPTQDMASDPPHMIIQCKRQKDKVEKVVVKGLYADVQFQNAECGLIVTTSELSPGAKKVISIRGYPIEEINNAGLRKWLTALQVPGSGIVRV